MTDLLLAVVHHLGMFGIAGVLAVELSIVKPGLGAEGVATVAKVDRLYGALAGVMLAAGFSRALFAAKGWDYFAHNGFFWAKIAVFALIGTLSAIPSFKFIAWRRAADAPGDADVARVRLFIAAQLWLFALLPVFAAAMARGHGRFG